LQAAHFAGLRSKSLSSRHHIAFFKKGEAGNVKNTAFWYEKNARAADGCQKASGGAQA